MLICYEKKIILWLQSSAHKFERIEKVLPEVLVLSTHSRNLKIKP
jgi:hypothetical protein